MEKYKLVKAENGDIWQQVAADLENIHFPFTYGANIQHNEFSVMLNIESDAVGGYEPAIPVTGFTTPISIQFTSLSARINESRDFRFAIHDQGFIDKLGKFFGMEDVLLGYPEFDKKLIVKTNDPERCKNVFAGQEIRNVFQSLSGFNLHIAFYEEGNYAALELNIESAITDIAELKQIYTAFVQVMEALDNTHRHH